MTTTVIPTYNGRHLLAKHLPEVLTALQPGDEVLIIDDASTDDTQNWMVSQFELTQAKTEDEYVIWQNKAYKPNRKNKSTFRITYIKNLKNLRFAQSVNRGVVLANGEIIWLLNNDVSPRPSALDALLPYFKDASVFAVGSLEFEDEPHAGKRRRASGVKGGKNKLWFERGMFVHSRADSYSTGPTAWASGGSAAFDKTKWLELGGFDKAYYPAYWEDVDLSFRARKRGWKVLFEERSIVYHQHETTNKEAFGSAVLEKLSWRHASTFVWKNGTIWQKIAFILWRPYWWWVRLRKKT